MERYRYQPIGLEKELYTFTSSNPLIDEGDLRDVYASKTKKLPEVLNEEAFTVNSNQKAQALRDDMELRGGTNIVLSRIEDLSDIYFIIDIGHAHLPGVAEMLVEYGIDCSFVIPGNINERFMKH